MRSRAFSTRASCSRRGGFTAIELVIALTLGTIVLGAAVGYLIREMRTLASSELRQSMLRNGRYVGVSLRHDLQRAGIEIKSTTAFGTLATWPGIFGDTLVVLHVPYLPDLAPAHALVPPPGSDNPLPPGGTCGPRCVEVLRKSGVPFDLGVGDLARLQILETRRLILIEAVDLVSDTSARLTFTNATSILGQPAGLSGGTRLDRFSTFVQKLTPIVYFLAADQRLMRAVRLDLSGSPDGDVLAYDVERFDVRLVFADGDELEQASAADADDTNDFDDIVAVKIQATVTADRVDPRVNQGQLLRRSYEWTVAPRNLRYEKHRQ